MNLFTAFFKRSIIAIPNPVSSNGSTKIISRFIESNACKHENKFEFIKIMKAILSQLDNQNISQRNDIELINLSSNLHPETINKIVSDLILIVIIKF